MTQVDNVFEWQVTMPIQKSESNDKWIIRGIAAGAGEIDSDGDMMMPEAIEMLAAQINASPVPFRNWHRTNDITEDLGEVIKAVVTPDFRLEVEVELDQDNHQAEYLWKKISKGKQYGMSVRGDSERPLIERGQKRYISKHHTVHLKEVSVTTKPYFTHSLGTVLRKAIDEAGLAPLAISGENTNMADSTNGETPATQESSAPKNDTVVTEVSPSQEIVKSLMENADFRTLMTTTMTSAVRDVMAESNVTETTDNTEVEKSETEEASTDASSNMTEIVKSAVEEVSKAFSAQLEALANKIPDTVAPAVLQKSEEENITEILEKMSPSDRLRAGLAAKHGETDKLR